MKNEIQTWLVTLGERIILVIVGVIVFLLVSGGVLALVRCILDMSTKVHWMLGMVVAVLILVMLIFFQALLWIATSPEGPKLRQSMFGRSDAESSAFLEAHPGMTLSILLGVVVFIAIISMATISSILHRETEVVEYKFPITTSGVSQEIPSEILVSKLLDYYGWHLIDSIPVLGIWDIFEVKPPLISEGMLSKFLVLIFRIIIVAQSISLINRWTILRKQSGELSNSP